MSIRTYSQKSTEVERNWYLVDASGQTLGRLAANISKYLIGKQKPTYTPHIDGGDFVVVINAKDIKLSGNKLTQKKYYRHSGYPGGLSERTLQERLESHPDKVIQDAVAGMLPDNRLKSERMLRLKVYVDSDHAHEAQKPQELKIDSSKGTE